MIVLIRRKIFRRTQSAQRTRKIHKNYELGKSWRNKCVFKWALNCKKLVMLRRLLGSEFQTVGAANMQNRGQIWRKGTLEMTEIQNSQFFFVLNTKFQRQPVKLSEDGSNMLVLSLFSDETGRTVLNSLKTIYLIRSDTSQCRITKMKMRGNNRMNKTSSRFSVK